MRVEPEVLPSHLGIIMDGNRRWAQARGLPFWRGHLKGQEVLRSIAHQAFERGVKYMSVYAFSTENWKRTEEEVGFLMNQAERAIKKYVHEFVENGVRLLFIGSREGVSPAVLKAIDSAEAQTANNTSATLVVCFNYGGLQEIADAAKAMTLEGVAPDNITTDLMAKHLYHPELPPIDLAIRTGGEQRLSNFMLWRAAYAELYFTHTLWPDFAEDDLDAALNEYALRWRRFGK